MAVFYRKNNISHSPRSTMCVATARVSWEPDNLTTGVWATSVAERVLNIMSVARSPWQLMLCSFGRLNQNQFNVIVT